MVKLQKAGRPIGTHDLSSVAQLDSRQRLTRRRRSPSKRGRSGTGRPIRLFTFWCVWEDQKEPSHEIPIDCAGFGSGVVDLGQQPCRSRAVLASRPRLWVRTSLWRSGRGLLRCWPVVLWRWPSRPACLFVSQTSLFWPSRWLRHRAGLRLCSGTNVRVAGRTGLRLRRAGLRLRRAGLR